MRAFAFSRGSLFVQLRACGARRLGKKKEKKMVAVHEVFHFFCFFLFFCFFKVFDL